MILGKWETEQHTLGLEFHANGTVTQSGPRALPTTGSYKIVDANHIELKLASDDKPVEYHMALTPASLTLTTKDTSVHSTAFDAVDDYGQEFKHPNYKPNDQQKKWIVGSWRGVEKKRGDEDVYLYSFYADGTFSLLKLNGFLDSIFPSVGTYRVYPDADNFIELTYPDTGKSETIYAEISEKELGLLEGGDKDTALRKCQRVADSEERKQLVSGKVTPAFVLFRECVADVEKSKAKYGDKPLELIGTVAGQSFASFEGKSTGVVELHTGNAVCIRCQMDMNDKTTREYVQGRAFGLGKENLAVVTIQGKFDSVVVVEDGKEEGIGGIITIKHKGAKKVLRLKECKIVSHSELAVK